MDYMREPMNGYSTAKQGNQRYDQSYTYRHYYQSRKSYSNPSTSRRQTRPPTASTANFQTTSSTNSRSSLHSNPNSSLHSSLHSNPNSSLHSNPRSSLHSNPNSSLHSNLNSNPNANPNTNPHSNAATPKEASVPREESLLWKDVYGKQAFEDTTASHTEATPSSQPTSDSSSPDYASLFKILLQNSGNDEEKKKENNAEDNPFQSFFQSMGNGNNMPDMETILKFKKIFDRLNEKNRQQDPILNLLYAVKPFLQESKKPIIDQIVKFMKLSSVLQDFNSFTNI